MRVLLAAKYVPTGHRPIGGVQSWIATVRRELGRLGHSCVEWEDGMPLPEGFFDLGVLANMGRTGGLSIRCGRTLCVSHGIIDEEAPRYAHQTFFVSEGVRDHWGGDGEILRQPIDLDFWKSDGRDRGFLAVRFSYRGSQTMCGIVAKNRGFGYRHVRDATPIEARSILSRASLVFASGRAALEAMACGAPTVIYDHRQAYQGPLMDTDLQRQMANSYSGRGGVTPNLADLTLAAANAVARRDWVEKHHDSKSVVEQILNHDT